MSNQSFNRVTRQLVHSFDNITDAKLDAKTATADDCHENWRKECYVEHVVSEDKAWNGAVFARLEHSDVPACFVL